MCTIYFVLWILVDTDQTWNETKVATGARRVNTWNQLLTHLRRYYDKIHPVCPSKTTAIKDAIFPILDSFIESYSECIVEVPRLDDVHGNMQVKPKFSAYNICEYPDRSENSALIEDNFESICYETSELIEEGYNFLRVEASEILAFVATNSNRIVQPGIPPHIPIAYGMRGHSLSMNTMRDMVDDIRNELKSKKRQCVVWSVWWTIP